MNRVRDLLSTPLDTTTTTNIQNLNLTINVSLNGTDSYAFRKDGKGKMRTFVVLTQGEDGYIVAECPSLPGCVSQGKTREEALENIKEAIDLFLEVQKEMGFTNFVETIEVEV